MSAGTIFVQAQEQGGIQQTLFLKLRGVKLDKKDFFGKISDYSTTENKWDF